MMISRRTFLKYLPVALAAGAGAEALAIEPYWISETELDFHHLGADRQITQFSDLHYKGNHTFAQHVIGCINTRQPDYVVFTGDLVEKGDRTYLAEALELIQQLSCPCFGVPGNHDPMDAASLTKFRHAFEKTGGQFMLHTRCEMETFVFHGAAGLHCMDKTERKPKILLSHFPAIGDSTISQPYDLTLCGHSHGGQVRLPLWGALVLPPMVNGYVKGLYESKIGPLYVNVGVGTYLIPIRFCCRPEITHIRI
jgi:hypothetical protein